MNGKMFSPSQLRAGLMLKPATPGPANAHYTCTRLRVRRTRLLGREDYMRMLEMDIPQIARFIGEHGYAKEIHTLDSTRFDTDRLEVVLMQNLSEACQNVRELTSGPLRLLTEWYLHRWDIVNIMVILRGKRKGFSKERIADVIAPAGDIDAAAIRYLAEAPSEREVVDRLVLWQLYPIIAKEYAQAKGDVNLSALETRLYRQYYIDLLRKCETGIPGADLFAASVRLEIDLANFRNLIRIRTGTVPEDIREQMLIGGDIPLDEFQRLAGVDEKDAFLTFFRGTHLFPLLVDSYNALFPDAAKAKEEAEKFIAERWLERKRPLHEMERTVNRLRLSRLEQLSKRNPFSILPVLVYLERKKYEVFNIRAIIRGLEDGVPPEKIQQFLVI